ncbi:MAG: hypothetical protein EXR77_16130 [Myxococcales bacterium]|nr:hypothetical protein [Myxococcales bacterium]
MHDPQRTNLPTPGHRMGPRGWTLDGLTAHIDTVFAIGPGKHSQRVVCRSRLDWPMEGLQFAAPWQFGWRAPHGRFRRALGCVHRCPVHSIDLHPADDYGSTASGGSGLAPDLNQVAQIRNWLNDLNLTVDCAVVAGFPQLTATGARVPIAVWLPRVWLADPDPTDDDGLDLCAIIDRSVPSTQAATQVGQALQHAVSDHRTIAAVATDWRADIQQAATLLSNSQVVLRKIVAGWPHSWPTATDRRRVVANALQNRNNAWIFDVQTPDHSFVCASPELLVRCDGDNVEALALAGTQSADGRFGPHYGDEHATVVDFVAACWRHQGLATPQLTTQDHQDGPLIHRATRFVAPQPAGFDMLSAALHLHPTPALLGTPRLAALQALPLVERETRQWYGGFAGVVAADGSGVGQFAVLLRGIEPISGGWRSWAGAGLVAGCDVAAETEEIERKHAAIAQCFGLQPS